MNVYQFNDNLSYCSKISFLRSNSIKRDITIIACLIKNVKKPASNTVPNINKILINNLLFTISKSVISPLMYFSTTFNELPISLGVKRVKILATIVQITPMIKRYLYLKKNLFK